MNILLTFTHHEKISTVKGHLVCRYVIYWRSLKESIIEPIVIHVAEKANP